MLSKQKNTPRRKALRPQQQRRSPQPEIRTRRRRTDIPSNLDAGVIMPPQLVRKLRFLSPLAQLAAAQDYFIASFRMNDPYDPDPLLATTGCAGLNELFAFYEFAVVINNKATWVVCNNESFPVMVGMVYSQVNLNSTILTRQKAIDALENGISTGTITLQQRAGGKSDHTFVRYLKPKALLGNPSLYRGSPDYLFTSSSSPTDQLWVNLIVISPTTVALLNNGVIGSFEMEFTIDFFGRKVLGDTPSPLNPPNIKPLSIKTLEKTVLAQAEQIEKLTTIVEALVGHPKKIA